MEKTRLKQNQKFKAFTLIEIILYMGLLSIFIIVIAAFLSFFTQARLKSSTIEEVNQQGMYLNEIISQSIRDGSNIASPIKGNDSATLILNTTKQPARNPIKIELINGVIYMTEGAGAAVAISGNRVIISSLNFQNTSQSSTNGNITFQYTINYINLNNRNEFNFRQTFYGSATTR